MAKAGNPFSTVGFRTNLISKDVKNALKWARRRVVFDKPTFDEMSFNNKLHSWTVAGDLSEKSILEIQKKVNNAIEAGQSYVDFSRTLTPEVLENITVPRIVWRNAINQVYQKGRFDQQTRLKSLRPFLQYVTFGDKRVRPNHAVMNGKVARQDSSFWRMNYPPNGHGCRCQARALTPRQVKARGLNVKTQKQIERDVINNQVKAGIPESKVVLPRADKEWRGSFAGGNLPVIQLDKTFSKPPAGFLSLLTREPVKLLTREKSAVAKAEGLNVVGKNQETAIKNAEAKIVKKKTEHASIIDEDGKPYVFSWGLKKPTTIKRGKKYSVGFNMIEIADVRKMKNPVLTHNHTIYSVGLSDSDMVMISTMQLKEIRAVTQKYIYRARLTDKTDLVDYRARAGQAWNKHFNDVMKELERRGFAKRKGSGYVLLRKKGRFENVGLANEYICHETNLRFSKEFNLFYRKEKAK